MGTPLTEDEHVWKMLQQDLITNLPEVMQLVEAIDASIDEVGNKRVAAVTAAFGMIMGRMAPKDMFPPLAMMFETAFSLGNHAKEIAITKSN